MGNQFNFLQTWGCTPKEEVEEEPTIPARDRVLSRAYGKCPVRGPVYASVQVPTRDWPEGVGLSADKMYKDVLLCLPTNLMGHVIAGPPGGRGPQGCLKDLTPNGAVVQAC